MGAVWPDPFSPLLLAALIFGGALASLELHTRVRQGRPWRAGWRVVKGQPRRGAGAPERSLRLLYGPSPTLAPPRSRGED